MKVTPETYVRAETDRQFGIVARMAGGVNQLFHFRRPTPLDQQNIVRMNRDTLYSMAVVDTSKGATISVPAVPSGRYASVYLVDNDHYCPSVIYGSGTHELPRDTQYLGVGVRIQVFDPKDADEVALVNGLQDQFVIRANSAEPWPALDWDAASLKELTARYEKDSAPYKSWKGMMGPRGKVDETTRHIAAAAAWGLFPEWDATYLNYSGGHDHRVCHKATYQVPENDAFWSITVYGSDGFMKSDNNIVNSSNVKLNADGTFDVYFGSREACGEVPNRLDVTEGWNFLMRIYRPGRSVLEGAYKLPRGQAGAVTGAAIMTMPNESSRTSTRSADHLPGGPVPGTVMHPAYAAAVARLAYVWGWPLVNMHNRREVFRQVPSVSYVGGAPMAPPNHLGMYSDYVDALQRVVAHPNQDVVYGFGILSPGESPVVVQVPDFGDPFWVYAIYDQRTDEIAEIGRQYGTAPGFYLVVAAAWSGEVPAGIAGVIRLATSMGVIVPRVFMDDTADDREAIQSVINQVTIYPLAEFDGRMKITDWTRIPSVPSPAGGRGEMKWVQPETFFDQLGEVLDEVPPLPGEEAFYGQMRALLGAAASDSAVKTAVVEAATRTETELVDELFYLNNVGVLLPGNWTRGFNGAAFGTDYLTRLAMAKSNIFVNRTEETVYFYQYRDAVGARLSGAHRYTLTFPAGALPPVRGFWSLTMYDDQHFFNVNEMKRYSLGTKNKTLQFAADGSLTIYLQHDEPADDRVSNWLPTPAGPFATTIRSYWPEAQLVEGAWLPPAVERL